MAFYFVSTFANAQTPTKQRPYGYRGLKIFTSLKLRFQDFQRRTGNHQTISRKYFSTSCCRRCTRQAYQHGCYWQFKRLQ
ncbi:hypothetical protein [Bathymodiolus japonicus methanotrophic gill symbiont]|uniref:hypothetical protein n=1 Tax=Bathymodiolus japonicus methanotrophic gill symbiont TaxID=113269 RepID=UPI001E47E3AE|nr:hypothetical protein [Bathymodiolus japonicus methanotrophic gill symbiont]